MSYAPTCGPVTFTGAPAEAVCTSARRYAAGTLRPEITLRAMSRLVRSEMKNPQVWRVARKIAAETNSRDQGTLARAIRKWCDARFRYVRDPQRVELLQSPSRLLTEIATDGYFAGDCDEASILTAALCCAVGIRCEFHAVSFRDDRPLSHVFAVAYPDRGPCQELDIVRPRGVKMPASFPRRLRAPV